jgi:hypothetical protein
MLRVAGRRTLECRSRLRLGRKHRSAEIVGMSSVRVPQEKKRLSYQRDHYAKSKYDKARKSWRTKKHKARRSYRHAADSLTKAAVLDGESDANISALAQRPVRRWGVSSLRETVAHKLDKRLRRVGAKKARSGK